MCCCHSDGEIMKRTTAHCRPTVRPSVHWAEAEDSSADQTQQDARKSRHRSSLFTCLPTAATKTIMRQRHLLIPWPFALVLHLRIHRTDHHHISRPVIKTFKPTNERANKQTVSLPISFCPRRQQQILHCCSVCFGWQRQFEHHDTQKTETQIRMIYVARALDPKLSQINQIFLAKTNRCQRKENWKETRENQYQLRLERVEPRYFVYLDDDEQR